MLSIRETGWNGNESWSVIKVMECILLCVWETDRLITKNPCLLWRMTVLCLSHCTAVIYLLSLSCSFLSLFSSHPPLYCPSLREIAIDGGTIFRPVCFVFFHPAKIVKTFFSSGIRTKFIISSSTYKKYFHARDDWRTWQIWFSLHSILFFSYWWSWKMYNTNVLNCSVNSTVQKTLELSVLPNANSCGVFDI